MSCREKSFYQIILYQFAYYRQFIKKLRYRQWKNHLIKLPQIRKPAGYDLQQAFDLQAIKFSLNILDHPYNNPIHQDSEVNMQ